MNLNPQEIVAGALIIVLGASLVGVGKLIVGFFQGLQTGQTQIIKQCQDTALTLEGFKGRFAQGEQWMQMHQEADDKSFEVIQNQHDELKDLITNCSGRHES